MKIVTLFLLLLVAKVKNKEMCYFDDPNPYYFFGTITNYDVVYHELHKVSEDDQLPPGCKPEQIWMFIRIGTSTADTKIMKDLRTLTSMRNTIVKNHEQLKSGTLCPQDVANLKAWTWPTITDSSSVLTDQGHRDMVGLATRIKEKYPHIFEQPYDKKVYEVYYTIYKRSRQSAAAFMEGLFGSDQKISLNKSMEEVDTLRPYSKCKLWAQYSSDDSQFSNESKAFQKGPEMASVIKNVTRRSGFKQLLTLDQMMRMYNMCRYERAWLANSSSPWCALFQTNELQVLEFAEDLKNYYKYGPALKSSFFLGCMSIKNMMYNFVETDKGATEPAAVFHFSHTPMCYMSLTTLGIGEGGPPPKHNNFLDIRRDWSSSRFCPYGGNVLAVLLKCESGEQHRVKIYVNEKRVDFKGCKKGVCSFDAFLKTFESVSQCDLDWCSNAQVPAVSFNILIALLFFLRIVD